MREQGSRRRPLQDLPPTETLDLGVGGLSLSPRLKVLLTFFRTDPSVRPVDEWQLRRALLAFLREPLALSVPEEDLLVHKRPDLHKRKREEHVASGTLFVRDLGFLKKNDDKYKDGVVGGEGSEDVEGLRKKFLEWRDGVVGRLDGIELNLEGVKFRLCVEMPPSEDFDRLKKVWEDFYANQSSANRYSSRGVVHRPDTLVVTGVPSRWFAEPRVSSKPSMLVTHTIFSALGKIRNLNVACNDDPTKKEENKGDILSGLHCKEGSRLKADYEVSWDRDGYFRCIQHRISKSHVEVGSQTHTRPPVGPSKRETPRLLSEVTRVFPDGSHRKRFRE